MSEVESKSDKEVKKIQINLRNFEKKEDTKGRPSDKKGKSQEKENRKRKEPPTTEESEKNKTKNIKLIKK